MQAPKDGDSAVSDVRTCQDRGEPAETFATRNCSEADVTTYRMCGAFMRGFAEGLAPLGMDAVRVDSRVNADVTTYRMCEASVSVSGLELLQCLSPELLGRVKGAELREAFHAKHGQGVGPTGGYAERVRAMLPTNEPEVRMVPVPQVLAWSGGGSPEGAYGRVTIGIDGREVAYVPAPPRDAGTVEARLHAGMEAFAAWLRSPYTAATHQQIARLQTAIAKTDGELSRVLHELAGSASLCWSPKPEGTFDSGEAVLHVERAIVELRAILRDV